MPRQQPETPLLPLQTLMHFLSNLFDIQALVFVASLQWINLGMRHYIIHIDLMSGTDFSKEIKHCRALRCRIFLRIKTESMGESNSNRSIIITLISSNMYCNVILIDRLNNFAGSMDQIVIRYPVIC